jgi:hypothetical protein
MVKEGTLTVGVTSSLAAPIPGIVVEVDEVLVDVEDVLDVLVLDVLVLGEGVVELGAVLVVVVGRDGGGGRGGNSMSPRSGNCSWEQSTRSPVSPSTKLQ